MTAIEKVEEYILKNPSASAEKMRLDLGVGIWAYYQAKRNLAAKGLIKTSKSTNRGRKSGVILSTDDNKNQMIDSKSLMDLIPDTPITEEMFNDDEIRQKLLKQIQKLAFDPNERPDIRLSATQVWVKLKDMAQQKDLGPGTPKDENAVIDRLVRIMTAVGEKMTLAAFDLAFTTHDEATNDEDSASSGTSEALSPA